MTTVAQQERLRCEGIFGCPEAHGRRNAATVVALGTELGVDAARRLLAAMPTDEELTNTAAAFWADVRSEIKA